MYVVNRVFTNDWPGASDFREYLLFGATPNALKWYPAPEKMQVFNLAISPVAVEKVPSVAETAEIR
jgi:hypothetical protein